MQSAPNVTPLDALVAALLQAADYDPRAEAAPAVLLWCDPGEEFASLVPLLRTKLPGFLTFGDYQPTTCRGPAIWLRSAVGRALPEPRWPADRPAVAHSGARSFARRKNARPTLPCSPGSPSRGRCSATRTAGIGHCAGFWLPSPPIAV